MRVRYNFGSRHTRTAKLGIKKQRPKFPALLSKIITTSDIILEVLDARFIRETRNKEVENEIKSLHKILIFILNKADLVSKIKEYPKPFIIFSTKTKQGKSQLIDRLKIEATRLGKERVEVGVIGFPNTGKSSVINLLRGKKSARTSSSSGFTRGIQKLKLTDKIYLFDSPGVIPSSEYSGTKKDALIKHTKIAARDYSKAKNPEMVIHNIIIEYPDKLEDHYKIKEKGDSEVFLEKLGRKLNYLKKGNQVDTDRTARKILRDWQQGEIKI
ncbi:MAG: 50S ribosome-binding GTPase [Nanoarchaeota archaeon]|nr:50S ribosome-binding GTPase [Nanoarchaeota archaeon]